MLLGRIYFEFTVKLMRNGALYAVVKFGLTLHEGGRYIQDIRDSISGLLETYPFFNLLML